MKGKAAIYVRVSSEAQLKGSGLEVQIEECQKYADEMGYHVFDVYKDEGISGAHRAHHRAGLEQMMVDAREGRFEFLLVHEMDRLARELGVGMSIVGSVADSNICLVEVGTRTVFADSGALLGLVKLWSAGEDRKKILTRTKRGHISRAKKGKVAGPPPLGYDRDAEGRLVINEEEATLVRRLYDLYLNQGYNMDSLAVLMNNEGVKTKRAKMNEAGLNQYRGVHRWQRSTIHCLVRNPVYKGEYIYGKTRGRVPANRDHRPSKKRPMQKAYLETAVKNRSFIPHEVVTIQVPAIIDTETWQRAQDLKKERYQRTHLTLQGEKKYPYNFNSMVRCHHCGRVMMRTTITQKTKTKGTKLHPYYTCRNAENACPNAYKHHRLDVIDAEIMARLFPYLKNPDLIRQTLSSTLVEQQQERNKVEAQRVSIERRISDLHLELKRLRDGFAAGVLTGDELKMERQTRDDAIAALKVELADAEQRIEQFGIDDLEEKVELVVSCLSQPGFHAGDPALSLATLFPNRLAQACNHYKTKGLTVMEYQRNAVGWPATDDMDAGKKFLKVVQTLVKRVTIDTESRINDYVLWIEPTPPEGPDGEEPENHRANLNSMTSPSLTTYSLPSRRTRPFSLAAALEPDATRSL